VSMTESELIGLVSAVLLLILLCRYARDNFWGGFYSSLAGFEFSTPPPLHHFRPYLPWGQVLATTGSEPGEHRNRSIICKGNIRHVKSAYLQEVHRLQKLLVDHPNIEFKMTIISPTWHHIRYKSGKAYDHSPYTNDSEYFSDLVVAYQEEIAVLYNAGLRNIQIDAPELSFFCDENIRAAFKEEGQDPDILLHTYIDVLNQCMAKKASDLHVGLHICPGILSQIKTMLNTG
jgi:methionine synthase II (cobalamin-independent)